MPDVAVVVLGVEGVGSVEYIDSDISDLDCEALLLPIAGVFHNSGTYQLFGVRNFDEVIDFDFTLLIPLEFQSVFNSLNDRIHFAYCILDVIGSIVV